METGSEGVERIKHEYPAAIRFVSVLVMSIVEMMATLIDGGVVFVAWRWLLEPHGAPQITLAFAIGAVAVARIVAGRHIDTWRRIFTAKDVADCIHVQIAEFVVAPIAVLGSCFLLAVVFS